MGKPLQPKQLRTRCAAWISRGLRLEKSARIASGVSPAARLASMVRSVTLVPLKTGSHPQIWGSRMMRWSKCATRSPRPRIPCPPRLLPILALACSDPIDFLATIQSRVGRLLVPVSSYRYETKRTDEPLRTRLVELARETRFGYWRGEKALQ